MPDMFNPLLSFPIDWIWEIEGCNSRITKSKEGKMITSASSYDGDLMTKYINWKLISLTRYARGNIK